MIPEEKQPAVVHALNAAFGVNEYEDISLLTGGQSSALAFKIVVRKNPYLLKIMRKEVISDPTNEFACWRTAAEAGIAPHIHYASVEDRLLITDFVQAQPYPDDFASRIAPVLHTLHDLPGFAKMRGFPSYIDAMDGFVRRFQAAKVLPESTAEELFRCYDEVLRVYPRGDAEMVASHNDLKAQNTLFDGERIWLVDWEAAFLNDRYTDLSMVANFFVRDEAGEEDYLHAYFGEPAGDYRLARFILMRQVLRMSYAAFFYMLIAKSGIAIDLESPTPDSWKFHRRLISGEADSLKPEDQLQYMKVHVDAMQRDMRTQRFADALAVVGGAHASA
jgi:hypothetical protein